MFCGRKVSHGRTFLQLTHFLGDVSTKISVSSLAPIQQPELSLDDVVAHMPGCFAGCHEVG